MKVLKHLRLRGAPKLPRNCNSVGPRDVPLFPFKIENLLFLTNPYLTVQVTDFDGLTMQEP